ncbi:hypothetical protein BOTBODRAFT_50293 [Botryobasidium botryosum FD-172 SS1]|uniref:Uncharacterized protein n=1 Tax=Botryobasidium botryosum (strain FD-172 SS1) TaxID=930990 RepID=A0A067N413_BOTB1|nr:hypothetical protein BOTBODRAFT_50293 [Botryobasidium botryosum FD-172 SS1]
MVVVFPDGIVPGTPAYLPALLSHLRSIPELSFPPPVFTPIFLCLIAGEKNLVLRTKEEDVPKLAHLVEKIFVSLFGLPTQRIQLRSALSPAGFLREVFLNPPASLSSSLVTSAPGTHPHAMSKQSRSKLRPRHRKLSIPRPLSTASSSSSVPGLAVPNALDYFNSNAKSARGNTPSVLNPRRQMSASMDDSLTRRLHFHAERGDSRSETPPSPIASTSRHSYTPVLSDFPRAEPYSDTQLPHALVLSKLEKVSIPTQNALSELLRTRTVTLDVDVDDESHKEVWKVPPGFMVVYVAPIGDERERPPISKGLLDRFAFSTTVQSFDQHTPRLPFRRASHITQEMVQNLNRLARETSIHPRLDTYVSSLLTATRHHAALDGTLITARCMQDFAAFIKASRVAFGGPEKDKSGAEPFYASEVDAMRILGNIVGHRVRVRDGRGDEMLGSMWGTAVGNPETAEERQTVQSILQEVIKNV